jgi:hypothetical protein
MKGGTIWYSYFGFKHWYAMFQTVFHLVMQFIQQLEKKAKLNRRKEWELMFDVIQPSPYHPHLERKTHS